MRRSNTLGLAIVAGLTTIVAIAPAANAQQVELRLKGSEGETASYSVDLSQIGRAHV